MRAVFEVMGVTNMLAKCLGSTNPYNVVRATLNGLMQHEHARPRSRPSAARRSKRSRAKERTWQIAKPAAGKKIKVTLVKGIIGTKHKHRAVGARPRPASTGSHASKCEDTPAMRGMINRVSYLVKVEE